MASLRQTVVQPLGLITLPNTYGQYPAGALSVAQNVVFRAPGEVWAAPGFGSLLDCSVTSGDGLRKLFPIDNGHIYTFLVNGPNWSVFDRSPAALNTVTLPTGLGVNSLFSNAQVWPLRARERMLVNTNNAGGLVLDVMNPTNATERALRSAGMPQPHFSNLSDSTVNAGTIPATVAVNYAAILKRVFSDGYQVISVPSPVIRYANIFLGATVDVTLTVKWPVSSGVIAGDIIEIYRTDGVAGATAQTDPGDTLKLVGVHTIVSGDLVSSQYVFKDVQACQAPFYQTAGRELYTNPGQETALQANRQPSAANAHAKFKTFTFLGDITERARWTFQVPGGYGDTGSGGVPATAWWRLNGIGTRRGTGTITNGSAAITGVSATEMIGIVTGQIWAGGNPPFPTTARVLTAVGTTITMDTVATGNAGTFVIADAVELDGGTSYRVMSLGDFILQIAQTNPKYEITLSQSVPYNGTNAYVTGTTISIEPSRQFQATVGQMTVRATNGQNYQEPVPLITATAKTFTSTRTPNLLQWSKDSQPEHYPPGNSTLVGTGQIISMIATKNALWIFCTDGLYRLSGDTPPFRVDWADPSCLICAPQAMTQLKDTIYAYTNYGITAITDETIGAITDKTLANVFTGPVYANTANIILERNEADDEVIVWINDGALYVYNTKQLCWSLISASAFGTANVTALAYQRYPQSGPQCLLMGSSVLIPQVTQWNPGAVNFLQAIWQYQPWYGDDYVSLKQFIDLTGIFNAADAGKTMQVTIQGAAAASSALVTHNNDAYGTITISRTWALAQSISPGFSVSSQATQFKFRGVSIRLVPTTNQAWRV